MHQDWQNYHKALLHACNFASSQKMYAICDLSWMLHVACCWTNRLLHLVQQQCRLPHVTDILRQ